MTTPMIQSKDVTVNGKKFQMSPLPVLMAARVNGQLSAIFGPLLMGQVPEVSKLLLGLPDEKQEAMVAALVSTTIYLPDGPNPMPLDLKDPAGLNAAFGCDIEGLYSLLFEILEYNGFPFWLKVKEAGARFMTLMEGLQKQVMENIGSATTETSGSGSPMSEEARRALDSVISGAFPQNSKKNTPSGG